MTRQALGPPPEFPESPHPFLSSFLLLRPTITTILMEQATKSSELPSNYQFSFKNKRKTSPNITKPWKLRRFWPNCDHRRICKAPRRCSGTTNINIVQCRRSLSTIFAGFDRPSRNHTFPHIRSSPHSTTFSVPRSGSTVTNQLVAIPTASANQKQSTGSSLEEVFFGHKIRISQHSSCFGAPMSRNPIFPLGPMTSWYDIGLC